jgi:hypothetical protein
VAQTSIADLVAASLLTRDAELVARAQGGEHRARLQGEAIELNGQSYSSLSAAAVSITGKPTNGWTFWRVQREGKLVPLSKLREQLRS